MPKVTSPDTDILRAIASAVRMLSRDAKLESAIPTAIAFLTDQLPHHSTFLLELEASPKLDQSIHFGQLLIAASDQAPRSVAIPPALLEQSYTTQQCLDWLSIDKPLDQQYLTGNIDALHHSDIIAPWRFLAPFFKPDVFSYALFPLWAQGSLIGVLAFLSDELSHPWQDECLLSTETFSALLSERIYQNRSTEQLTQKNNFLRNVIDLSPNLIFVKDTEGRLRLVNQTMAKHFGGEVSRMEGELVTEVVKDQGRLEQFSTLESKALKEKTAISFGPRQVTDAEGNQHWLQTFLNPLLSPESENVAEVVGFAMDITALQETQMALEQEQWIRKTIASTIPDNIFLVDVVSETILYRNFDHFLGYPLKGDVIPLSFFIKLMHPDVRQPIVEKSRKAIFSALDDQVIENLYNVQNQAGEYVWISERVTVFQRFPDGRVKQYISVVQDITEKQETLRRVSESEQRYRNFIEYSIEGIYFVNCRVPISRDLPIKQQVDLYYEHATIEECNLSMARMYGLSSQEELVGKTIRQLHTGPEFKYNQQSFFSFIKKGYRIEDVETKELDAEGNLHYFINRAVGIVDDGHLVGVWGVQQDITAKRKTEKALAESELRLSSVISDTKVGIWEWYVSKGLVIVNQNCLDMLGRPIESTRLKEEDFWSYVHPEDISTLQEAIRDHIRHATDFYQTDIRLSSRDAGWLWVQIHGRKVETDLAGKPSRIGGSIINIHEKKLADLLLKEGETLLKVTLNTLPDIKIRINQSGQVLSVYSPPQERTTFSMLPEEMVGKNLTDCLPNFVAKGILHNSEKARREEEVQDFEFVYANANENKHFEARINALNDQEAMVVLRNISALKKAEKGLNENIRELDIKNRQLQAYIESNLQLENFAYIASHDLREPVRTMRTFAQILKRHLGDQLDEDALSYLGFIINGANQMNELIEDLLTYSRVNTDPMEKESIDLAELLEEINEGLASSIGEFSAQVTTKDLPKAIFGSRVRIKQLFQNLIANGIKFARQDVPPSIRIGVEDKDTHWQFAVEDNGIGISPEYFEQIFKLFKKLHSRQDYEGTGIGLALCEKIIEQHHGEIWLESTVGEGTTFYFTLAK